MKIEDQKIVTTETHEFPVPSGLPSLSENLHQMRITQKELAQKTGINIRTVRKIIRGEILPTCKLQKKIANVLNEKNDLFEIDFYADWERKIFMDLMMNMSKHSSLYAQYTWVRMFIEMFKEEEQRLYQEIINAI